MEIRNTGLTISLLMFLQKQDQRYKPRNSLDPLENKKQKQDSSPASERENGKIVTHHIERYLPDALTAQVKDTDWSSERYNDPML